jgi:hypothetical protein
MKVTELLHCFLRADSNLQVHSLLSPAVVGWLIIKGPVLWLCLYRTGVRGGVAEPVSGFRLHLYRQPGILTRVAHMLPSIYVRQRDRKGERETMVKSKFRDDKPYVYFNIFSLSLSVVSHQPGS